jgi:hypothetical protein
LASVWALRDLCKGGTLFGFALPIFAKPRTSVEAKTGPVENRARGAEEGLHVALGGGRYPTMQEIKEGEREGFLLLLRFAPGACEAIKLQRSGCRPREAPKEVRQ